MTESRVFGFQTTPRFYYFLSAATNRAVMTEQTCDTLWPQQVKTPWSIKGCEFAGASSRVEVFSDSLTNLCHQLPPGGGVLTGLDAEVPPPLQDVDHRLC